MDQFVNVLAEVLVATEVVDLDLVYRTSQTLVQLVIVVSQRAAGHNLKSEMG